MPDSIDEIRPAFRLAIQLGLLPLLALILFGLFGFILPGNSWSAWQIAALVVAGGVVLLLAAWPLRAPVRVGMLDALAATLALSSVVPGIAVTMLIMYSIALRLGEHEYTTRSVLYQLTSRQVLGQCLKFALVPVVPGLIGLWLAKRRVTTRTSRAAIAARFSLLGLALSALIGCAIILGAAYHRVEWP